MTSHVGAFPPPNALMVIVHLCVLQVSILMVGACRNPEDAEVAPPGVEKWPLLYLLAVPHL